MAAKHLTISVASPPPTIRTLPVTENLQSPPAAVSSPQPLPQGKVTPLKDPYSGVLGTLNWVFWKGIYYFLYVVNCTLSLLTWPEEEDESVLRLRQKVGDQQRAILQTALKIPILKKSIVEWDFDELMLYVDRDCSFASSNAKYEFVEGVVEVRRMIQMAKNPQSIRQCVHNLMTTEIYQKLKKEKDNPAIEFLQIVCMKFIGAKGKDLFAEYGRELTRSVKGDAFNCDQLATILDTQMTRATFNRDGRLSTLNWGLHHPLAAMHSLKSQWFPLEYNSHDDNPNVFCEEIQSGGRKVYRYYGPGPTGDSLYNDGYLEYMDKHKLKELRSDYQDMHKDDDAPRKHEILRYQKEHPHSMVALSQSFASPLHRMKKENSPTNADVDRFLTELREKDYGQYRKKPIGKESSVYIPDTALTDEQLDDAFTACKGIFTQLSSTLYWEKMSNDRREKVMLLGTHAIIGAVSVKNALEKAPKPKEGSDPDLTTWRVTGACKQGVDRGMVETAAERLFYRFMTDQSPLTRREMESIVGAVTGRAMLVEDRRILQHRYHVLSDFLHLLGNHECLGYILAPLACSQMGNQA